MKFKVGDKVRCLEEVDDNTNVIGEVGKIVVIEGVYIGVEFNKDIGGHALFISALGTNRVKPGHGWWCGENSLRKFNMQMSNK